MPPPTFQLFRTARLQRLGLGRRSLMQLAVLGLWLAAFAAAALLEYAPHASLWFPPAAVTFAGFAVLGLRAAPALVLACLLGTVLSDVRYDQQLPADQLLLSAASFALAHCLSFGSAAFALRWTLRRPDAADSLLRPVAVFLLAGSVAALLSAVLGSSALAIGGMIDTTGIGGLIVPWMIGDYAGLVSLGPLCVLLLRGLAGRLAVPHGLARLRAEPPGASPRSAAALWPKLAILLGLTAVVLLIAAWVPDQPPVVFTLFLAIVVQMWIVHTQRTLHSLLSIAAFSLTIVTLTAVLDLGAHALTLQFVMIALAANSYFGLAVPELYADNSRLRRLMMSDSLTGASSRPFFIEQAKLGLETARERGEPAALVMIDLDDLKTINDIHGHAAGDHALKLLVTHCRSRLTDGQFIGRLSGDEFCVFLPGADAPRAMRCVASMREALARIPPGEHAHEVSASFGIAVTESPDESYESLLSRADQAMYEAKRAAHGPAHDDSEPRRRYR